MVPIAVLAVLVVVIIELPASMLGRFLPAAVGMTEFSGSVWHGAAGSVTVNARPIGAIEWHIHPWPLLGLALVADLHWVKGGFVVDGAIDATSTGLTLRGAQGGGPLDDLHDLGIAGGWRGTAGIKLDELKLALTGPGAIMSVDGDVSVLNLSSPRVANGADLGGYMLHLAAPTLAPGADLTGALHDTGGPLAVDAVVHLSPDGHTGMLSGTIMVRTDAPPALRSQIADLAQLHAPDARGAIPVDLEFTL